MLNTGKKLQFAALLVTKEQAQKKQNIETVPVVRKSLPFCALLSSSKKVTKAEVVNIKEAAMVLAKHVAKKGRGKKSDDTETELALVVKGQVVANVGVSEEVVAQQLTDAGVSPWTKRKYELPLLANEREFIEKSYVAATKSYNLKMLAKKQEEYDALLSQVVVAKAENRETSVEYKLLCAKADKASMKLYDYKNKLGLIAEDTHGVRVIKCLKNVFSKWGTFQK